LDENSNMHHAAALLQYRNVVSCMRIGLGENLPHTDRMSRSIYIHERKQKFNGCILNKDNVS